MANSAVDYSAVGMRDMSRRARKPRMNKNFRPAKVWKDPQKSRGFNGQNCRSFRPPDGNRRDGNQFARLMQR